MTFLLDPRWGITLALPLDNQAGVPVVPVLDDLRQTPDTPNTTGAVTGTVTTGQGSQSISGALLETFGGTVATAQRAQSIAAVGKETFSGTVSTAQGSQSIAASGTVAMAIVGAIATGQGSQTTAATGLVADNADTHDGGDRKRKPIIDVKPGWEPIHGLKTRKKKRIDDIEIAPLVASGQPDLVAEHYARMREEEEIILLLAA